MTIRGYLIKLSRTLLYDGPHKKKVCSRCKAKVKQLSSNTCELLAGLFEGAPLLVVILIFLCAHV